MARIGLLEDNNRIAKICATMLSLAGHEVTIYEDAYACLNALTMFDSTFRQTYQLNKPGEVSAVPIDALILDLHLPVLPGLEVLRLLRNCPRTCALPVVFCTAATPSEINGAFAIAPDALLVEKPFKLQTLVSAISKVLPASLHHSPG